MDGLSIAASLTEISTNIVGSTIRTVYHPAQAQFILRVFSGEDVKLAIDLREASIRITSQALENPASPSAFAMLLRKHLKGGRIAAVTQWEWDRVVSIDVTRMDGVARHSYRLIAELVGTRGNLLLFQDGALLQPLRSDDRNHVGHPYVGLLRQNKLNPIEVLPSHIERWLNDSDATDVLSRHVEGIGRQTAADVANQAHAEDVPIALTFGLRDLLSDVQNPRPHISGDGTRATFYPLPEPAIAVDSYQEALDRVRSEPKQESLAPQDTLLAELTRAVRAKKRTIEKLHDWLDTSSQADTWQSQADLLMIYQSDLARGLPRTVLTRPEDGQEVTITLDPSLSALENAQALYTRAKRIRRGHPHVHARLEKCTKELDKLQRALERRRQGDAVDAGTLKLLPSRRKQKAVAKKAIPFRQFEVLGYQIWVGKSARQNDVLLRAAAPNDLWMHAKDYAGSHVVIRVRGQDPIPDEVIQAAGRLAAQYSKAGSERRVEVTMTRVKNVRKPKGAPAGLVNVRDTDTLTVRLPEGEA